MLAKYRYDSRYPLFSNNFTNKHSSLKLYYSQVTDVN